ncbi:hypothetical protein GE21DRAFT_1126663 [Neurospora crassa]|nr:hypothetical protein GE21DRAFT_1126663 [Neurospora crassa]
MPSSCHRRQRHNFSDLAVCPSLSSSYPTCSYARLRRVTGRTPTARYNTGLECSNYFGNRPAADHVKTFTTVWWDHVHSPFGPPSPHIAGKPAIIYANHPPCSEEKFCLVVTEVADRQPTPLLADTIRNVKHPTTPDLLSQPLNGKHLTSLVFLLLCWPC